jgi:ABC-2 type transport system permease protein
MHPRIVWAIARKDALDLWLNKATLGGLLAPIVLSLVYLLIGKVVGSTTTNILVYNPGNSKVDQVVSAFQNTQVTPAGSGAEVSSAFSAVLPKGATHYAAGLVVPPGFDASLAAGQRPQLQLFFDGKAINPQTQVLVEAAIINYCRSIASPTPPVDLVTSVVNKPANTNSGAALSKFYASLILLVSLMVGITFMPQLLIEEKEKKTLRMLMVSPASFADMLFGKLIIVLIYQFILTGVVMAIQDAFTGQVGFVVLYALLGGLLSLSLGLLLGTLFSTVSASSAAVGPISIIFIIAGIFVGPLGDMLSNSPVTRIVHFLPTYYLAEGVWNATNNLGTFSSNLLDVGVVLGTIIVLLVIAARALRRQSAVAGSL